MVRKKINLLVWSLATGVMFCMALPANADLTAYWSTIPTR